MNKQIKNRSKLRLSTQTVRRLDDLQHVSGGKPTSLGAFFSVLFPEVCPTASCLVDTGCHD